MTLMTDGWHSTKGTSGPRVTQELHALLPHLRAFAALVCGSKAIGDAAIEKVLKCLVSAPFEISTDAGHDVRETIFQLVYAALREDQALTLNQPIICYVLREFAGLSVDEVAFVLGRTAMEIEDLLRNIKTYEA